MGDEVPFGSNEVRLSPREWVVAGAIIAAILALLPVVWALREPGAFGPDYRIPYRLSNDYWLYSRYCRAAARRGGVVVVGDSVVWGHYVAAEQTLSHHLGALARDVRFANLGVDGIHPAALAGLVEHYGRAIRGTKVILHCNLLWMSSKRHDLRGSKEFAFNHPRLVPQFFPRIPCYGEGFEGRLAAVVGRTLPFMSWAEHLRIAYFDGNSVQAWSLDHPYENPLRALGRALPGPGASPVPNPQSWTARGLRRFNARWVALDQSLQWRFFRQTVDILQRRGNRVFVVVGPFNEHMLTDSSRGIYRERKGQVEHWLRERGIPCFVPAPLPTDLYADASHPLADGYALLARWLLADQAFRRFLAQNRGGQP